MISNKLIFSDIIKLSKSLLDNNIYFNIEEEILNSIKHNSSIISENASFMVNNFKNIKNY